MAKISRENSKSYTTFVSKKLAFTLYFITNMFLYMALGLRPLNNEHAIILPVKASFSRKNRSTI